jgi:hypothetical protein
MQDDALMDDEIEHQAKRDAERMRRLVDRQEREFKAAAKAWEDTVVAMAIEVLRLARGGP